MARLPPDCAICFEPLAGDLAAASKCGHVYHRTCSSSLLLCDEWHHCVLSDCFSPVDSPDELQGDVDDLQLLKARLSLAHANIKAFLETEAPQQRENTLLKEKLASLEGQLQSYVERTTRAEAAASEFHNKLVQLQASRDRVSAELVRMKRAAGRQAILKKYLKAASSMTQEKAVQFLRGKYGEDIDEALRVQHGTICHLRRLRSTNEKLRLAQPPPQTVQEVSALLQKSRLSARELRTRLYGETRRTPRAAPDLGDSTDLDLWTGSGAAPGEGPCVGLPSLSPPDRQQTEKERGMRLNRRQRCQGPCCGGACIVGAAVGFVLSFLFVRLYRGPAN
ncbi:hypothetical protein ACSSS7_003400 [Eimeria intestinalis]